jgi:hypothetical protein
MSPGVPRLGAPSAIFPPMTLSGDLVTAAIGVLALVIAAVIARVLTLQDRIYELAQRIAALEAEERDRPRRR